MPRFARVVATGVPHHITQRGNARRLVFDSDSDRRTYLQLLRHYARQHSLSLLGYCLMSNHVHLVAIPQRDDSMALALRHTHGRYASYLNARQTASGHVWQGRFYSCPLDDEHLWAALRYVERNPARAGMIGAPWDYAWSSATAHCGGGDAGGLLDRVSWEGRWTVAEWREFVGTADADADNDVIRRNTHSGRPLGARSFVEALERTLDRKLVPGKGGRPRRRGVDATQGVLSLRVGG